MSKLIISIGAERFGSKQPKAQNITRPNRRETKISQLRKELKALKQQYKRVSEEERPALSELRDILRQKLNSLRCTGGAQEKGQREGSQAHCLHSKSLRIYETAAGAEAERDTCML